MSPTSDPAQSKTEPLDEVLDAIQPIAPTQPVADPVQVAQAIVNFDEELTKMEKQRERDAWIHGGMGVMAGMICTLFVAALGR